MECCFEEFEKPLKNVVLISWGLLVLMNVFSCILCVCVCVCVCVLQECPSGVVNEETFKLIYSQFFPQGGQYSTNTPTV